VGLPVGKSRWWTVVAATLGLSVSNGPLIQYSFGTFIKPLGAEFHANRGELSAAVLVAFIFAGSFTPVVGFLVDRYGVRAVLLPGVILFALAIAALSLSPPSALAFIALYGVAGAFSAAQTPLAYSKSVVGNFEGHRGLALGISMSGVGLGAAVVPQVSQFLIGSFGWRAAYVGLGGFMALVSFLPVLLLLREPMIGNRKAANPGIGLTGREALATPELWSLAFAFTVLVAAGGGMFAHVMPMLTDRGIPPQTAVSAISAAGISLIVGRFIGGWLLDRIFAPYVTLFFILVPFAGMCLLYLPLTPTIAIAATTAVALGVGAEIDLMGYLASRYFGMRFFGEIYGYMFALFCFGAGLGPFLMGLSFAKTGSYGTAIIGFAACLLVSAALIFSLGPYRYPAVSAESVEAGIDGATA
jgi:predicted MFS family arabinose efflux permease